MLGYMDMRPQTHWVVRVGMGDGRSTITARLGIGRHFNLAFQSGISILSIMLAEQLKRFVGDAAGSYQAEAGQVGGGVS